MESAAEPPPSGVAFPHDGFDYGKHAGIATITIDRPDKGNSLSSAMKESIRRIWRDVRDDPAVRAVVVTGRGERHFSTGADVTEIAETGRTPSGGGSLAAIAWSPIQNEVWKPVVCAVNGLVAGGGLHFVADADVVVAAETAAFMDTHVSVGQVGAVENVGLSHRVPLGAVLRMTLQGRSYRLTARRAYELGLVDELAAPGDLARVALDIAAAMAANSPTAVRLSKQAIWHAIGTEREAGLETAWRVAQSHWAHPDFLEGARAFAEKRPPRWAE